MVGGEAIFATGLILSVAGVAFVLAYLAINLAKY